MKTPSNSHHISQAWVEYILTQYECKKVPETVLTVKYFTISKGKSSKNFRFKYFYYVIYIFRLYYIP